jgi:hypothetical protein
VTGKGDTSRRIGFLIDSDAGDEVWGFVCWSIVAKRRFDMKRIWKNRNIHLEVDEVSWIFGILVVASLGICFFGILSSTRADFFLKKYEEIDEN